MSGVGERWQQLEDLVQAALDCPVERREALVTALCDDAELRAEALELAAAHDRAGDFLELAAVPSPTADDPARVGPYRVLRRLGRGGMGDVYLAVRDDGEDLERQVAVKLLAPGLYGRDFVRRFRAERRILARLEHPNIARLYDGGTHADGRPYLVMEHVEGRPLHQFCAERRLGLRARLELVLAVCDAVDHAHRRLVLHLDLKPENILVLADGTPKLLDFGIAKLLDPSGASLEHTTRAGPRPLTPHYASPEQRLGGALTTASDVYSLGVVLYRLLSGRFPVTDLTTESGPASAWPPSPRRPSAADPPGSTRDDEDERALAPLRRQLVGDLDAIVLKALRPEPELRYETVGKLAEDLRRHLEGLPVLARQGTLRYRLGKLVRRRKGPLLAATLGVALVVGFGVAMAVQAARLDEQRLAAERERRAAEAISVFLMDLLGNANRGGHGGRELTVGQVLDYGHSLLARDHGYFGEPEVDAELRVVLARLLRTVDELDRAELLLRRALEVRVARAGEDDLDVAEVEHELGWLASQRSDYTEAERRFRRVVAVRERWLDEADPELAAARLALASAVSRRAGFSHAEPLFDRAIEPLAAHASTLREQLDVLDLRRRRAVMLWDADPEAALAAHEALVAEFEARALPPYPDLTVILMDLGTAQRRQGRPQQAVATLERALRILDEAAEVPPWRRIPFLVALARAHLAAGDGPASEQLLLHALDLSLASFGRDHAETRRVASYLRDEYVKPGRERDLAALEQRLPPLPPSATAPR